MKMQKSNIAYNLTTLRQLNKFSQEEVAARIGVSRQTVAKWEAGQSVPDMRYSIWYFSRHFIKAVTRLENHLSLQQFLWFLSW